MKKPILPSRNSRTLLAVAAATAISAAGAFAQVSIPAQSSSSLDQEDGSTGATVTAPTATTSSPFSGSSNVSRVNVPTPTTGGGNVTRQVTPAAANAPTSDVAAIQQVPLPRRELDPATEQRLADLRRELKISSAALSTRIALPADDLFLRDTPTAINDLAVPSLKKVMEYIELNDKKKITVQSYFNREPEAKELSWARSLALIEWMTTNSTIDIESIKASGPAPVAKPTPKPNSTQIGDTEFVNRIELILE